MQYKLGERKLQAFILGTEQAPPTPSSSSSNAAGTQRGAAAAHYDQPAADAPSALATALTRCAGTCRSLRLLLLPHCLASVSPAAAHATCQLESNRMHMATISGS